MSKLKEIIEKVEAMHPYKEKGKPDTYSDYNQGWQDCIGTLQGLLDDGKANQPKETHCPKCKAPFELESSVEGVNVCLCKWTFKDAKFEQLVPSEKIDDLILDENIKLDMPPKSSQKFVFDKIQVRELVEEIAESVNVTGEDAKQWIEDAKKALK